MNIFRVVHWQSNFSPQADSELTSTRKKKSLGQLFCFKPPSTLKDKKCACRPLHNYKVVDLLLSSRFINEIYFRGRHWRDRVTASPRWVTRYKVCYMLQLTTRNLPVTTLTSNFLSNLVSYAHHIVGYNAELSEQKCLNYNNLNCLFKFSPTY